MKRSMERGQRMGGGAAQAAGENEACTQQADRLHRSTRHDATRR